MAQPLGAKFPANILISATNGSDILASLSLRWKNTEQGNNEIDAQVGLYILVRLATTGWRNSITVHVGVGYIAEVKIQRLRLREQAARRVGGRRQVAGAHERM